MNEQTRTVERTEIEIEEQTSESVEYQCGWCGQWYEVEGEGVVRLSPAAEERLWCPACVEGVFDVEADPAHSLGSEGRVPGGSPGAQPGLLRLGARVLLAALLVGVAVGAIGTGAHLLASVVEWAKSGALPAGLLISYLIALTVLFLSLKAGRPP